MNWLILEVLVLVIGIFLGFWNRIRQYLPPLDERLEMYKMEEKMKQKHSSLVMRYI
ncbi:MAG: hypothetical protein ACJAS9_002531 [Polaribacter sp.]|jgi:hypothetical protein